MLYARGTSRDDVRVKHARIHAYIRIRIERMSNADNRCILASLPRPWHLPSAFFAMRILFANKYFDTQDYDTKNIHELKKYIIIISSCSSYFFALFLVTMSCLSFSQKVQKKFTKIYSLTFEENDHVQ